MSAATLDLSAVKADARCGGLPADVYHFAMVLIERTFMACEREARAHSYAPWALNYGTLLEEAAEQAMREAEPVCAPQAECGGAAAFSSLFDMLSRRDPSLNGTLYENPAFQQKVAAVYAAITTATTEAPR